MASVSTARSRIALMGLAVAGALVGSAGGAAAQYYDYEYEYDYAPRGAYGYGYRYDYAPLPRAPLPPRAVGRIAAREFGLTQVDRMVRTNSSYIVDGQLADGGRARLIFDLRTGDLVDRIILRSGGRERAAPAEPRVARIDPREDRPAQPRIVPRPPERPASLKPPAQASAPAQAIPPSPAAPARAPAPEKPAAPPAQANAPAQATPPSPAAIPTAPEPDKPAAAPDRASRPVRIIPLSPATPPEPENPVEQAPAQASAPATILPSAPAAPPAPTPGPTAPSGEEKPKLVNPNDVRGTDEAERQPPLARADPSGISVAPVELPPVQIEDSAPSTPKPATPAVPVAPLE